MLVRDGRNGQIRLSKFERTDLHHWVVGRPSEKCLSTEPETKVEGPAFVGPKKHVI